MSYQSRFAEPLIPKLSSDIIDERVLVFRITHIDNIELIVRHGLCSKNYFEYSNYKNIGAYNLIDQRSKIKIPCIPKGTVDDYVSFYFTPCSPMLHNILRGKDVEKVPSNELVFFVSSLVTLAKNKAKFVFSDRHVSTIHNELLFSNDLEDIGFIDWDTIESRTDCMKGPYTFEQNEILSQAEALVFETVPAEAILKIVVYNEGARKRVQNEIYAGARGNKWFNMSIDEDERYYW